MKKIHCSGCNGVASYQSERWPSVQLCYTCIQRVLAWLILADLADGNPFAIELAEGPYKLREWNGLEYYEVWAPTRGMPASSHSYSTYAVNLERISE